MNCMYSHSREGVAARCAHGAHSNGTLSHVLVLADQFLPICHLMIQLRDFESKLRDVGFQQETEAFAVHPCSLLRTVRAPCSGSLRTPDLEASL